MDPDPLFIRNPDPNMTGDDPLFVVNPKYLVPQSAAPQYQQPLPMYDVTQRPPVANPVTTPYSMFSLPQSSLPDVNALRADWMSHVPDDAPLAALSVPGTHNSLAGAGGPSVQTQTWDIGTQLRSGIRYLDIRLCQTANDIVFRIPGQPDTSIHVFMGAVTAFLRDHPKEALLVRIKDECRGGLDFYIRLHQTLNEFYAPFIFPLQIPGVRLGAARGKIVIIKDYQGGPPGGVEFDELDKTEAMAVASPEEKDMKPMVKQMKKHLKKVISSSNFEKMFLTEASAFGPGFLYQYAAAINDVLSFYLHKNPKGRLGIVAMDFPSEHVINDIIARNFSKPK